MECAENVDLDPQLAYTGNKIPPRTPTSRKLMRNPFKRKRKQAPQTNVVVHGSNLPAPFANGQRPQDQGYQLALASGAGLRPYKTRENTTADGALMNHAHVIGEMASALDRADRLTRELENELRQLRLEREQDRLKLQPGSDGKTA